MLVIIRSVSSLIDQLIEHVSSSELFQSQMATSDNNVVTSNNWSTTGCLLSTVQQRQQETAKAAADTLVNISATLMQIIRQIARSHACHSNAHYSY